MERRDRIAAALDVIETTTASLTTSPPDEVRQFAAAATMRCCALVRAACVLEDAGLGHLAGIMERQNWETWVIGLHVLLRGDDALLEVAGDDVHYKRLLSNKLALGLSYQPDWQGPIKKLNWKELADALGPLLVKEGEALPSSGTTSYDLVYRTQSLFAVHAGLATIGAYLRYGDDEWAIEPRPDAPFESIGVTSALHCIHLASYVFRRFGVATEPLEEHSQGFIGVEPGDGGTAA